MIRMSVKCKESKEKTNPKILDDLNFYSLEVGFLDDLSDETLMIASVHEYGCSIQVTPKMRAYLHAMGLHLSKDTFTIQIPERSMVRAHFDQDQGKIHKLAVKGITDVLIGKAWPSDFVAMLGTACVGMLQEYYTSIDSPPNHPFTIQMKGSSKPLMDSGVLRASINYRVR